MANDGFNGSTITFGATPLGEYLGITVSYDCPAVDISDSTDTFQTFAPGVPRVEVTCRIRGADITLDQTPPITPAALAITWNDATAETAALGGTWFPTGRRTSGDYNGAIETEYTFARATV